VTDSAPRLAPLGWGKRDPEQEAAVRRRARQIALRVAIEAQGLGTVQYHCAFGAACPFTSKGDLQIWLEEIRAVREALAAAGGRVTSEQATRLVNEGGL
jgi:hypothetical protein